MKYRFRILRENNIEESCLSRTYDYFVNYDVACVAADKYLPDRREYDSQEEYDNED